MSDRKKEFITNIKIFKYFLSILHIPTTVATPTVKPANEPQTPSALLTILRQEIDRFNRLLGVIHTSLTSLALAIKGEVVMSDQLEEMFKALLSQRVPKAWQVSIIGPSRFMKLLINNKCQNSITKLLSPSKARISVAYSSF